MVRAAYRLLARRYMKEMLHVLARSHMSQNLQNLAMALL